MKVRFILFFVIAINLLLNVYGNDWGLPSRLYADEKVTNVLHMLNNKTLVDVYDNYSHPTGYQLTLLIYMIPFLIVLKLIGYPVEALKEAASVSWMNMARLFPDFATGVFIYTRTLSAILGALTVYLIYLLGKRIYNERVGLYAAILLSVTLGFIGVNHFAKFISLSNFLITLSLLLCVSGSIFWAAFFSGLATSVQLNAFLLLLPLFVKLFFSCGNFKQVTAKTIALSSLFIVGFIVGTPSILFDFSKYASAFTSIFLGNIPLVPQQKMPLFVGPLNYFFELLTIYGILIFAFIICGLLFSLYHWKKLTKDEVVVFVFIFAYFFTIAILFEDKFPQTKHIISIVPLLTLLGGKFLFSASKNRQIKYSLLIITLFYSFAYAFEGDLVFKRDDTRYISTKWIYSNIPKDFKIETFQQIHFICLDKVLDDYEIVYLGQSSWEFKGKNLFNLWVNIESKRNYLDYINRYDSNSDFIIFTLDYMEELYVPNVSVGHFGGIPQYIRDLFEGRKNFKLVKVFTSGNQRLASKKIKGFYYPESILWNPVPCHDVISPTIYVFEKNKS